MSTNTTRVLLEQIFMLTLRKKKTEIGWEKSFELNNNVNRIYNKILDRDQFSARLFVT